MESFNDVISGNTLVLVDFFATWCQPCKTMHPILEKLKAQMGDKLRIIKVDIDQHHDTSNQYNIQSVPTMMLFRNGEQLWRQSGAMPLTELNIIVSNFLNSQK